MKIEKIEHYIVDWIGIMTVITFILLFFGILRKEPGYFEEFLFLFKVFISLFLIYRFNDFRKNIKFTELDRKFCFLAGINLLLISFADLIDNYIIKIKASLKNKMFLIK